ncbi:hypothetical protein OC834_007831, partial [Tilletia horrida]
DAGSRLKIGKAHDQLEALGFYYVVVLGPFALSLPSSPTSCFASALSPLVALSLPSSPTSCFASAVSPLATLRLKSGYHLGGMTFTRGQVQVGSRRGDSGLAPAQPAEQLLVAEVQAHVVPSMGATQERTVTALTSPSARRETGDAT